MTAATCRHGSHPDGACRECARAADRASMPIGHDQPRDRTPAIGERRPREGRCKRCDRPLCVSDDTHDTGCSGPDVCHAGRWACDCDGEPVDWRARALEAEAALADAEARGRAHGLLAAAWHIGSVADSIDGTTVDPAAQRAMREAERLIAALTTEADNAG